MNSILRRLLPVRLDNESYRGPVAALWLFALFLVLRAIMGVRGATSTRAAASGDGISLDGLDEGGAETILLLFQSLSLTLLPLVVIGVVALWRWRGMVPFLYLVLVGEQLVRRLSAVANPVVRTEAGAVAMWINLTLLALLLVGLSLSLWSRPSAAPSAGPNASRPSPAS